MLWLADWSTQTAGLLWLVVQYIPQSFASQLNIYPVGLPSLLATIIVYNFLPLHCWPVRYPEEYLYTSVIWILNSSAESLMIVQNLNDNIDMCM